MADKITNFEDYKKKDTVEDTTMDIQIEDPYNFFNEQEREEYFQERQKELAKDSQDYSKDHRRDIQEDIAEDNEDDYPEEYDDDDYEEDEEESGGFPIELFIRISSIITGIIILAFLAIVAKVKIYDRFFAPDPDEAQTVVVALPSGYTEKNDTVVVTAEMLNLRSVDNSGSKETILGSVAKGTELKRIAVNADESWALVEYEGNRVYASMKYLSVK